MASVVLMITSLTVTFELNLTVKISKKKPRTVYKFAKADLEDIHHDAETLSKNFFKRNPENISIEGNWQFFKSGLLSILDSRVPKKRSDHGMIPLGLLGISRNY